MVQALATAVVGGLTLALVLLLAKVPHDVARHDRLLAERDEDLDSWLADTKLGLDRHLREITNDLVKQNLLYSGERNWRRVKAKEDALHRWRDEERGARRFRAELEERETLAHQFYRWYLRRPRPLRPLETPVAAAALIAHWRSPEYYEGSPVLQVDDPTQRTLASALEAIRREST